jgi:hypothetical protein
MPFCVHPTALLGTQDSHKIKNGLSSRCKQKKKSLETSVTCWRKEKRKISPTIFICYYMWNKKRNQNQETLENTTTSRKPYV